MRITINRSKMLYLLVLAFMGGLCILLVSLFVNGKTYAMHTANRHLHGASAVDSFGSIEDRNGLLLADTKNGKRVYNNDSTIRRATLQTIGDTSFFISSGVHNTFKSELTGFNMIWGINTAASGAKSNLKLTLDAKLCKTALNALEGQKGAVGVYNYKTGEIIVMVSSPTYDIQNKPYDIDTDKTGTYDGVYLNKLLSGLYVPGSVFKTVTAAAAIDNIPDILTRKFNCSGQYKAADGIIKCMKEHGNLNFEQALNVSCNSVFAQVAIEVGAEKLQKTAQQLGLTESFTVDRVNTAKGSVELSEAGQASLGWAGIGQYTLVLNPVSIMRYMGAIANDGKAVNPFFVDKVVQTDGTVLYKSGSPDTKKLLNVTTTNTLKSLMRSNVKNNYGDSRFKGLELCAKTGTAEVGEEKSPHAWFAGFSQRDDFPYAFVCVVENGGSGIGTAAPVIARVLKEMDKTY